MTASELHLDVPHEAVIVFDIDDTLYLEESYVRSGFQAVGRLLEAEFGVSGLTDLLWSNFLGGTRGDAFDRALTIKGIDPNPVLVRRLVECYRNHEPEIQLSDDARLFLGGLEGRNAAAITDGPAGSQRAKVRALGLERFLSPIVLTSELGDGVSKPHPLSFEIVQEQLGVRSGRLWYVGDNPSKDFKAPLRLGWKAIRVRRSRSLHREVATPNDVIEIATFDQLHWSAKAAQV